MHRIAFVIGTRPEAIKVAPVLRELQLRHPSLIPEVYNTGQHEQERIDKAWRWAMPHAFSLREWTLGELSRGARLPVVIGDTAVWLGRLWETEPPDLVVVTGDTASAFGGAIAAHGCKIPVAHLEAGLRSHNRAEPWPEEDYRVAIDHLASEWWCPTRRAQHNLECGFLVGTREVKREPILTGNTSIDAVCLVVGGLWVNGISQTEFQRTKTVLVTAHRRESWAHIADIACGLRRALDARPDWTATWVEHANPALAVVVRVVLAEVGVDRIEVVKPIPYAEMVNAVATCGVLLTDSGGLQEEAACFRTPVVVTREETERHEGFALGLAVLVGRGSDHIASALHRAMGRWPTRPTYDANPYGDGFAAARICERIAARFRAETP